MFACIGLGQCGSQIADLFSQNGYLSGIINSSQKDLDTCIHIESHLKLRLHGSEGVGRDRNLAVSLMQNNWEIVVSYIKDNFSQPSVQLIFITFSTAGGTGSGISPLFLEILANELGDKTIVAVPILPSLSEPIANQINTLECLKQLSELNICILPIDNEQVKIEGKNELYKRVNQTFYNIIDSIIEHTDKQSHNGNLDQKDLLTLFKTSGFSTLAYTNITNQNDGIQLSKESVTDAIKHSWQKSIFTKPSYTKIIRFGLIFNGQEGLMTFINQQNILNDFKNPTLDSFEGYYHENKGDVYTILTGLEFNTERLKQIEYKTISESESLSNILSSGHGISYKSSNLQIRPKQKDKKALSSILSKYQK
jgi:cell division GTPase FtsZ